MFKTANILSMLLLLVCLGLGDGAAIAAGADADAELVRLESAFLYQFTKFLEWEQPGEGDFVIVVVGRDRFIEALNGYAKQGKKFSGRSLRVVSASARASVARVDMLLIDTDSTPEITKALSDNRNCGCISVTTKAGQTKIGAAISFVRREDSTVGFTINPDAAVKNKVTIGSQLRNLAQSEGED